MSTKYQLGTILLQVVLKNFVVKAVAIVGKKENQAIRLVRIDPIYNFKHTLGEGRPSTDFRHIDPQQINHTLVDKLLASKFLMPRFSIEWIEEGHLQDVWEAPFGNESAIDIQVSPVTFFFFLRSQLNHSPCCLQIVD